MNSTEQGFRREPFAPAAAPLGVLGAGTPSILPVAVEVESTKPIQALTLICKTRAVPAAMRPSSVESIDQYSNITAKM